MISIIIPAYNEGLRIEKTIVNHIKHLKGKYEIIVVLNGCNDNTEEVIRKIMQKHKQVKYLNFLKPLGKGGAIIKGLKIAEGDIIGFVDADDSFDIKSILDMLRYLKKYDCVIASKWKKRRFNQVSEPFARKVMSRHWNLLMRTLLNLQFYDTQAGAKFFTRKVLNSLNLNKLSCTGFSFDAELLYKIKKKRFRIKEVFIRSKHIQGSTFKTKHTVAMFKDLMKLVLKK